VRATAPATPPGTRPDAGLDTGLTFGRAQGTHPAGARRTAAGASIPLAGAERITDGRRAHRGSVGGAP